MTNLDVAPSFILKQKVVYFLSCVILFKLYHKMFFLSHTISLYIMIIIVGFKQ